MNKEDNGIIDELDYFDSPEDIAARQKLNQENKLSKFRLKLRSFITDKGIIAGALLKFCDSIGKAFKEGFFAQNIVNYDEQDNSLRETYIGKSLNGQNPSVTRRFRALRRLMLSRTDRSAIISVLKKCESSVLMIQIRSFGAFLITFGLYAIIAWFLRIYILEDSSFSYASLVCGCVSAAAALPLLFTQDNLSVALEKSRLFRAILVDGIGVPPENLGRPTDKQTPLVPYVITGMVFGVLSFFVGSHLILAVIAGTILLWTLLEYPEIGPGVLIVAVPLTGFLKYPSITLGGITLCVALSFIMKAIKGKRKIIFGISELPMMLLLLTVLFSGFPPNGSESIKTALLTAVLIFGYFLIVNLVRNKRNLGICAAIYVFCATAVSVVGILQYFLGLAPSGWTDLTVFSAITSRATSIFQNPNMLGFYIIPALPVALASTRKVHSGRTRFLCFTSSLSIVLCTLLTFSRASWIGCLCGTLIFCISVSSRNLLLIPLAALGAGIGARLFPDTFGARIEMFSSLRDSANIYRRGIWNGVRSMLKSVWAAGIGSGDEAFRSTYILYAEQGIEAAPHAHSIFLQIFSQYGIFGFCFFILTCYLILKKVAARLLTYPSGKTVITSASFAGGMVCLLIAGIFDNIFYNYRLLFLFWLTAGLASAAANIVHKKDDGNFEQQSPESAATMIKIPTKTGK